MKKFCNNCREWKESWAEHSSYQPHNSYRRSERCWSCDQWTLSYRTIFLSRSSSLDRQTVRQMLDDVKENRVSGFTVANERYVAGERVKETVIYDGGENYTLITESGSRQATEYKRLETIGDVMGILFLEAVEDVLGISSQQVLILATTAPLCKIS